MSVKFQRYYTLTANGRQYQHVFKDPTTCAFSIVRRSGGSTNVGHFVIYNMNRNDRSDLRRDPAIDPYTSAQQWQFTFQAGYQSLGYKPNIFAGTINRCFSYREGPDVLTEIEVNDSGNAVQYAQVQVDLPAPWTSQQAAKLLVPKMATYGVRLGALGSVIGQQQRTRGITWCGNVWKALQDLVRPNGVAFTDMNKVFLMGPADVFAAPSMLKKIDASTGLLQTPRRMNNIIDLEMIFEPSVTLFQQLSVVSTVAPEINGTGSVQEIVHKGIISGAVDGPTSTAIKLLVPPTGLTLVKAQ